MDHHWKWRIWLDNTSPNRAYFGWIFFGDNYENSPNNQRNKRFIYCIQKHRCCIHQNITVGFELGGVIAVGVDVDFLLRETVNEHLLLVIKAQCKFVRKQRAQRSFHQDPVDVVVNKQRQRLLDLFGTVGNQIRVDNSWSNVLRVESYLWSFQWAWGESDTLLLWFDVTSDTIPQFCFYRIANEIDDGIICWLVLSPLQREKSHELNKRDLGEKEKKRIQS